MSAVCTSLADCTLAWPRAWHTRALCQTSRRKSQSQGRVRPLRRGTAAVAPESRRGCAENRAKCSESAAFGPSTRWDIQTKDTGQQGEDGFVQRGPEAALRQAWGTREVAGPFTLQPAEAAGPVPTVTPASGPQSWRKGVLLTGQSHMPL